jgi:small-conductance mechanosensitive channel
MSAEPLPLRWKPTLIGSAVAIILGSTLTGICGRVLQNTGGPDGVGVVGLIAIWALSAACIYGANQQGIGRTRDAKMDRFALCLLLAIPIMLVAAFVAVTVYVNLGGQL